MYYENNVRLEFFMKTHLTPQELEVVKKKLITLDKNTISSHIEDIDILMSMEDVTEDPGSMLIRTVDKVLNELNNHKTTR